MFRLIRAAGSSITGNSHISVELPVKVADVNQYVGDITHHTPTHLVVVQCELAAELRSHLRLCMKIIVISGHCSMLGYPHKL